MTIKKFGQAILLLVIATVAVPSASLAQTDAQKKQAKEHYEKATRFYDVGKYGEAISEYESAYLLVEDAALLFNIGQAYRLWDKPEDAIRTYKNYLRRRPEASNRSDVEKKISDLEHLVDERRHSPQTIAPPPTSPVTVPQTISPPPSTVVVPEVPPPVQGPPPPRLGVEVTTPSPSKPVENQRRWLPYALMGGGGVCLLSATIAGVIGAQKARKLETAARNGEVYDPAVQANGKTANGVAVLMSLVGVAAGGTGVYLYYRDKKKQAVTTALVAPVFSPTYAGGLAQLTF